MSAGFLIAIDNGTTGSRIFCYGTDGRVICSVYREFTQFFPKPGWVEHDADEIWAGVRALLGEALAKGGLDPKKALGIGITNQRETIVIWDRKTGRPIHHAIVWQCRRTAERCKVLKEAGNEAVVRAKTGLVIDAYFSATKIEWLLDNVPGARSRALQGELAAGTIDSWLLFCLTGEHKTEHTNASRTNLYNIREKAWDPELLTLFGKIPAALLPEVKRSGAPFGTTRSVEGLPDGIPVLAMLGDQQAATFGQLCVNPGEAKNTYGTGCFLIFNTGQEFIISKAGLLTTLACDAHGDACFALEGGVFIGGAVVQWLRDFMRFFARAEETEELVNELSEEDEDTTVLVPAFVGLGAPYWDSNARGAVFGLTRDTSPQQITRAALKSIALQSADLVAAMEMDTGRSMPTLRVDGGAAANNYLMQFQADILARPVERPQNIDTTALGAAYLAGIQAGIWSSAEELRRHESAPDRFVPAMAADRRARELVYWKKAVGRVQNWLE